MKTMDLAVMALEYLLTGQPEQQQDSGARAREQALLEVKRKAGSVTVVLGTRDTGKTTCCYRYCEFLGRPTYAVTPEQKPPSWVKRINIEDITSHSILPPMSTLVLDDLPAYASNRDYNDNLIRAMERMIPMVRHERKLHLVFSTQTAAQADRYILDADMSFLKPLGLFYSDLERPAIRSIYKKHIMPVFEGRSLDFVHKHAFMWSRTYKGLIEITKPKP